MKAIILSCGTGGGHNAAGKAVKEELEQRGHTVKMLNPYDLKSSKTSKKIDELYIKTVRISPKLFGAVYALGNAYRRLPFRSPVYFANASMVKRLENLFEKEKPDVVFMPHIFPAEIITNMKNRSITTPKTFFIATDYTCTPFTEEADCDAYIIPSKKLENEFAAYNLPRSKMYPIGIPVSRCFSCPVSREEAARALELDPDKRYILVSGGSMGAGKLVWAIKLLYDCFKKDENTRLIVICGSNEWLYRQLKKRYSDKITAVRFTDKIAEYMRVSDVYVTKPGGLSSTEGAVMGVPMVHTLSIPGCETANMKFFSQHGMSIPVRRLSKQLVPAVIKLKNAENAEKMTENQKKHINPLAASDICDLAEKMTENQSGGPTI